MPEKSSQEVPRASREQYEKGVQAFQRKNYDYALAILTQVLRQEPAFYECREALRATQFKKAGESGGFLKKMWGGASSSPMIAKGQLALRKSPFEALQIAEQILNGDPHSSSAHKLLADAALQADLPRTAILSLEILVKTSPKDPDLWVELAEAYSQENDISKAEAAYNEVLKLRPNDPDIALALKNLSARRTMAEGGYDALADGSGSYRDILRNKAEAVSLEQEGRQVKSDDVASRLILEYEARIQAEPDNLKLLRTVAELYTQKKEFDRALAYYNRIIAFEGAVDPSLEKAIMETTLRKFDHATEQLDPQAPDYDQQIARLKIERDALLIDECRRRAEKYPNDLQIRFELGTLYFKAGKISDAIQEFQKAQNNPQRHIQALNYLGQCFARRGMNDLAARTLQNALKEKLVFDDEKKELLYELGIVLEKMGKTEEAIEVLKQIYEVDIGYRDVAARVDAYYAGK